MPRGPLVRAEEGLEIELLKSLSIESFGKQLLIVSMSVHEECRDLSTYLLQQPRVRRRATSWVSAMRR